MPTVRAGRVGKDSARCILRGMRDETDRELLAQARAGDAQALEKLLERHQAQVYRFGLRMCRDPEDAKDVLLLRWRAACATSAARRRSRPGSTQLLAATASRSGGRASSLRRKSAHSIRRWRRKREVLPIRQRLPTKRSEADRSNAPSSVRSVARPYVPRGALAARRRRADRAGGGRCAGVERPGGQERLHRARLACEPRSRHCSGFAAIHRPLRARARMSSRCSPSTSRMRFAPRFARRWSAISRLALAVAPPATRSNTRWRFVAWRGRRSMCPRRSRLPVKVALRNFLAENA